MLLLAAVRIGLWVLPFRVLRRIVPGATGKPLPRTGHSSNEIGPGTAAGDSTKAAPLLRRVAGDITLGARYVPGASCLTQALAAQTLLHQQGIPSDIRIGVARNTNGPGIRAHAWLECDGVIVVGGEIMGQFTAFPSAATGA